MSDLRKAAQAAVDLWCLGALGDVDMEYLRTALAQPEPAAPTPLNENEADPYVLWAEIARLRAAVAGPKGFATWQDAATDERVRRVRAEQALGLNRPKPEPEPVAWIRWDDEENYYDVRRTPPPQTAIEYLAKWNRPPWVPAYPHPDAPPQSKPLTDEALMALLPGAVRLPPGWKDFARSIEKAHGIGDE